MPGESFNITAGMPVVDAEGRTLGEVDSILIDDETGLGEFLSVKNRLVPAQAVEEVENGQVQVRFGPERMNQLPERPERGMAPSEEERRRAYDALGYEPPTRGPR